MSKSQPVGSHQRSVAKKVIATRRGKTIKRDGDSFSYPSINGAKRASRALQSDFGLGCVEVIRG